MTSSASSVNDPSSSSSINPYLLEEAEYLKKSNNQWRNKQRTLTFCSRGVKHRHRHLLEDLKKLLPHHKPESKWEKKESLSCINEICELNACNNAIFLESRRNDLYMFVAKSPNGPSAKFRILNIHTLGELKLTGNCLLHSRPLLIFDEPFSTRPHLKLLRELFTQAFGTPLNHPKSKPFFDHAFCWFVHDGKIWFRHYQILPIALEDAGKVEAQTLNEIGPRFVMEPIKILEGSFEGKLLWKNPNYVSTSTMRAESKKDKSIAYEKRQQEKKRKEVHTKLSVAPEEEITNDAVFGDD